MTADRPALEARPFRALRYAPKVGSDFGRLIAPPYDVISPGLRGRLAGDPHNIVHLDLPQEMPGTDPYEAAADRLRSWVREGVLVRDPRPAYYLCEQEYREPDGTVRRRRGVFARLALQPFEAGTVIPHERTLERPRLDRRHLLAATRTHLSSVFMLHPDPGASVSSLLAASAHRAPEVACSDAEGIGIRLVRLDESSVMHRLERLLHGQWALIADGHHRYESALEYREERRAQGARDAEHILAYLCSLEDEGLSVLPIHRLIHSIPDFEPERARSSLAPYFHLKPVPGAGGLPEAMRIEAQAPGVFGLVFGAGGGAFVARWKEGAGLEGPTMQAVPEALRRLDVILLHRLLLEGVLGISKEAQERQTHIDYVKDASELLARAGGAQIAILLNPTRIEQAMKVSRAGLRLPPKSTYFHPKVPSGLVIDTLDD